MLASSAMCAILSLNQPTLRSVEHNQLAVHSASLISQHSQVKEIINDQVKQQLEMALTLELFAGEQIQIKSGQRQTKAPLSLEEQQKSEKNKCDKRSVETKPILPMVRNSNFI